MPTFSAIALININKSFSAFVIKICTTLTFNASHFMDGKINVNLHSFFVPFEYVMLNSDTLYFSRYSSFSLSLFPSNSF